MSIFGSGDDDGAASARGYDPYHLSSPQVSLIYMMIFLAIAAFVATALYRQISVAFLNNPGLNGLIVGVLIVGILLSFNQVLRLVREVRWVNSFRSGNADAVEPILLAPMKALLSRSSATALSTSAMRSILDSIANRLDEGRDITRYLVGLLVFLGLLGTFWGLLRTIGSIGETIQSLDPGGGDANSVLDTLKAGLSAPLSGMGTAFSSSLFGLSGSLIVGFLDLQAGRAQNRFYTELENWLSSVTDLESGMMPGQDRTTSHDDVRALSDRLKTLQETGGGSQKTTAAISSLADGIAGLVKSMRAEQQMIRDWMENQAKEQRATRAALEQIARLLDKQKGK
ncbi:MAG: MotA/TolQ/ExbB proton channel family protein [Brucellaceae bacterium]|nr:MotA/TolQ/ExbB proton channel family protein [Brucellaceae bacterium]